MGDFWGPWRFCPFGNFGWRRLGLWPQEIIYSHSIVAGGGLGQPLDLTEALIYFKMCAMDSLPYSDHSDRSYSASDLIEYAEGLDLSEEGLRGVDERDLALLVHMGRFLSKDCANKLRGFLRREKQNYDHSGELSKTPFALRNIKDPKEREWILANVVAIASVQGCTGGCTWCYTSALLTKDIEAIPEDQQKHLWSEIVGIEKTSTIKPTEEIMPYFDNDPLDDPSLLSVLEHFERITGGKHLFISTTGPKREGDPTRMATFKVLAKNADEPGLGATAGRLRVCEVAHRPSSVPWRLPWPRSSSFYSEDIRHPTSAGVEFYKSGVSVGSYGPMCHNGTIITPFGAFNLLTGRITREHPGGYLMVPFKGFDSAGIGEAAHLAQVLEHAVLLESAFFSGGCDNPKYILIFDGKDVQEIDFDEKTYEILKIRVAQRNVVQAKDSIANNSTPGLDRGRLPVKALELKFCGDVRDVEDYSNFLSSLRDFIHEGLARGVAVNVIQTQAWEKIKDLVDISGDDSVKLVPEEAKWTSTPEDSLSIRVTFDLIRGRSSWEGPPLLPKEGSMEFYVVEHSPPVTDAVNWLPRDDKPAELAVRP